MKKLKYLLLLILFIPVIALAEPIHLTQAAWDEIISEYNVENTTYKSIVVTTGSQFRGVFLNGGEYTLDEDVDFKKSNVLTSADSLTINLNGHNITNEQDGGYNYDFVTFGGYSDNPFKLIINGPGSVKEMPSSYSGNYTIKKYGGIVEINNATILGSINGQGYDNNYASYYLNNTNVTNSLEMYGGELYIEGGRFNYSGTTQRYNYFRGTKARINNAYITCGDDTEALSIVSNDPVDIIITNSQILGGYDGIQLIAPGNMVIENTEITGKTPIYIGKNINLTMSDVHMKSSLEHTVMYAPNSINTTPTAKDFYESFLKEGYIYWKDPIFEVSAYDNVVLKNKEIWIIKQQQDYAIDDEPTYIIPKDNEVTVSVLGEKDLLEGVEVDDDELDDTEYKSEQNDENVDVTINNNYLQSLDIGKHLLKVSFVNGEASTTITITDQDPDAIVIPIEDEPVEEVKGEEEVKEDKKEERTNPKTGLPNHMLLLIPITITGGLYILIKRKTYFKDMGSR